jgi:hypothetical protein
MVRQEKTGERSLAFSRWIKEKLPGTETGYIVENLDWIFHNYKQKILLIAEEKTHGGQLRYAQSKLFMGIIEPALKMWCEKNNIQFLGFHTIRFENTNPNDGKIYWDDELISEETLIDRLSW